MEEQAIKTFSFSEEFLLQLEEQAIKDKEFEKLEKRNMVLDALKAACLNSNIPERYSEQGFSTYIAETEAQKRFKNDMKNIFESINSGEAVNAVLCGSFGIGKTHLSCAILRGLLQSKSVIYSDEIPPFYKPKICRYTRADEIKQQLTDAKKYNAKTNQTDVINFWSKINYLVIDEIGGTDNAKEERDLLYKLLHNRYENGTSTILITNSKFLELCEFLGGAITDRLREKSKVIDCSGIESYRGN